MPLLRERLWKRMAAVSNQKMLKDVEPFPLLVAQHGQELREVGQVLAGAVERLVLEVDGLPGRLEEGQDVLAVGVGRQDGLHPDAARDREGPHVPRVY